MCGIYGYLDRSTTGISSADWPMIFQMAKLTELRGEHSSGVFAVSKDDKVGVLKAVGNSNWLWYDKGFDKFDKRYITNGKALIGHGRYATIGKVTKANAHPFQENHITLVHNGTIRDGINTKEHDVEVDSHALCVRIAQVGLKDAIGEIQGAWAVILHDSKEGKIHILRNFERELHFAKTHFGIFIMSEKKALEYLLERNKLTSKVEMFSANKLYSFDLQTKDFTEEGERIEGRGSYYGGTAYSGGKSYSSGTTHGTGGNTKRSYQVPSVVDPKAAEMQQVYEKGDLVEFTVTDYTIITGQYHYRCHDSKGNEIRLVTGNTGAAQKIKTGDAGLGEVIGFQLDYVRRVVVYHCRFREVSWNLGQVAKPTLVATRGGETLTAEEWDDVCKHATCFSCCSRLDPERPQDTVVVDNHRVFCPECVDDYLTHGSVLGSCVPADLRKFVQ